VSREAAGAAIRALRVARDWSLADLSAATGVSTMGLSYLERGSRKPQKNTVQKVENGLGLPAGTYSRLVAADSADAELAQMLAGDDVVGPAGSTATVERHHPVDMLETASEAYLEMLNSLIAYLPPKTSNEYEMYIQAAIVQSLKAAKLAANSWRVTANAGAANSTLMAHVKAAETIRADLMARLPGSIGAQFDAACVRSGLPDPVIAASIGVSVEQMWDFRTGAAIAPAALAAVTAFVAGES
jgi:transcriptional regulator with XRE-family HTH domain